MASGVDIAGLCLAVAHRLLLSQAAAAPPGTRLPRHRRSPRHSPPAPPPVHRLAAPACRCRACGCAEAGESGDLASPDAAAPARPASPRLLGGSLFRSLRSPRSWDSHRVGLGGLVDDDALADPATGARLLRPQMRLRFKLPQRLAESFAATQPSDCGYASPELGNVRAGAGAGSKPVLCSRSYGDVKSGPEVAVPGGVQPRASSHPADLGKLTASGSLPASIGGHRRYVRSVSATEVERRRTTPAERSSAAAGRAQAGRERGGSGGRRPGTGSCGVQ